MMRQANIPMTLAWVVLVVATILVGLTPAVIGAAIVYLIAYVGFLVYWLQQPIYDHATPASGVWPFIGWVAMLGLFYLFLRWWLWKPQELPFLSGSPFFGSAITVFCAFLAPVIFEGITDGLVIKFFRSKEPPGS